MVCARGGGVERILEGVGVECDGVGEFGVCVCGGGFEGGVFDGRGIASEGQGEEMKGACQKMEEVLRLRECVCRQACCWERSRWDSLSKIKNEYRWIYC